MDVAKAEALNPWVQFPIPAYKFRFETYCSFFQDSNKEFEKIAGYRAVIISAEVEPEDTIVDVSRMRPLFDSCKNSSECQQPHS